MNENIENNNSNEATQSTRMSGKSIIIVAIIIIALVIIGMFTHNPPYI